MDKVIRTISLNESIRQNLYLHLSLATQYSLKLKTNSTIEEFLSEETKDSNINVVSAFGYAYCTVTTVRIILSTGECTNAWSYPITTLAFNIFVVRIEALECRS